MSDTNVDVECAYCIDGMAPCASSENESIEPHFHACHHCQPRCRWCEGAAYFPAQFDSLTEFMTQHLGRGDIPIICLCCLGVIAVI
jgi:hypothetical protein